HGLLDGQAGDDGLEHAPLGDRLAVDRGDDVTGFEAGLGGRRAVKDLADDDARFAGHAKFFGDIGVQFPDLDTQATTMDLAVGSQRLEDVLGQVAGHGQPDALEAAVARLDGRVDADHLAFQVDQRAAAVARIDGGVGLDEILVHVHRQTTAALGADDAGRHRAAQAERRTDGQNAVADLHGFAIAQVEVRQFLALGLDADDGKVGFAVAMDVLRNILGAVHELDLNLVRSADDVVIGEDNSFGINYEA